MRTCQELHIPEGDVESLLVGLILDNRISGHIDQVAKDVIRSLMCRHVA